MPVILLDLRNPRLSSTRPLKVAAPLLLLLMSGCGSVLTETTADVSGIAGAGAASAVTKSAALATGIGLAVQSIAMSGLRYGERVVHRHEQERIAQAAGPLGVGDVAAWSVTHDLPIEPNRHGQVTVTRIFGTAAFSCKEIVFSIDGEAHGAPTRAIYTADVCAQGTAWQWASAEPATARWGALQ
jgi:uncharacterized protein YceK